MSHVAPDIEIVPFNHKFSTLDRAVKERVFAVKCGDGFGPPPKPAPGVFERRMENFRSSLIPLLPSTAPWSYRQFVDSYSGRKKQVYEQALEDLRSGRSDVKEDAKVKVFVKYEKTDRTTKRDPVPRVISPRDTKFNLRIGRYIKMLEHRIFRSIDRLFGHATVIKGYDAEVSAKLLFEKWNHFNDPVAVGLDASRFDQHVSLDALKFEHSIYPLCLRHATHRNKLTKLLEYQLHNHCSGYANDGKLKYSIEGTRMSGDMNTSLGNCILMCGLIWSYANHKGVRVMLANNGDDCVVFMERRDLARFSEGLKTWFVEMGFNMAVEEPVFEFEQLEFCQTKPVWDGGMYVMCRNPFTAIAKDSVMLKPWSGEKFFRGWLDAVGTGGLAMAGGMPIFQNFYRLFVRSGERRKMPDDMLSWSIKQSLNLKRGFRPVQPETRFSFWLAFGVTPDEQICIEKYYDGLELTSVVGGYCPRTVFPDG